MEIAESHLPALTEQGIQLIMPPISVPIQIVIDRDALIQVIQNLISNAVKYAPLGKEITITAKKLPAHIEIHVMDRGPGLSASNRAKIFRKFYRGDDRLTTETRGSGLGLTIARNLMREQGGDLYCVPREGGGLCFIIKISEN